MKNFVRISILSVAAILMSACQEVVDLPLNNKAGKLVIEGNISDSGDPAAVFISKTTDYKDTLFFDGVENAVVVIEHDGISDTLSPFLKGVYTKSGLGAISGKTYKLSVWVEGNLYTSQSTAGLNVALDTAYTSLSPSGRNQVTIAEFRDPGGVINFYKGDVILNGFRVVTFDVTSDRLTDGKKKALRFISALKFNSGDIVKVSMNSIDEGAYNYFSSLQNNTGAQSAAPANPVSNISGDALGYFSAHTQSSFTIAVP